MARNKPFLAALLTFFIAALAFVGCSDGAKSEATPSVPLGSDALYPALGSRP